jgi:molybdopterin-containing oxidoreductase family molybdopterin binding subunit
MSELVKSKINRRTFVIASAASSVLTYISLSQGHVILKALESSAASSATTTTTTEVLYNNVCANNCKQACRVLAHVYNGNLVFTEMNPMPNTRYNRICLRGISHAQRVYHPNRLKYPMKRVGPRGSGQWDTITWDEALNTIAQNIYNVSQKYGSQAVAFLSISGNYGMVNGMGGAINRFANVFQGTSLGVSVDVGMPLGFQQVGLSYYGGGNEMADIADNAKLIVIWGSNMTESDIHSWHFIADAIDNGTKIVVIDPHYSVIASKADQWINPTPGSDVALGMSLINVIINQNLYNTDFVVNHTVGPFLVNGSSGLFLRESDVVSGGSSKYMVWDTSSNSAKTYDQSSSPALTGQYTVGSISAQPAFQLLSDRVSTFTPEYSQGLTGVSADVITALATEYANTDPATIILSMGTDRWGNGYLNGRAVGTLAALTGNVGKSGATPMSEIGGYAGMYVWDYNWLYPSGSSASSLPQALMYDAILNGTINAYTPADPSDYSKGTSSNQTSSVPYVIKAIVSTNGNWISNNPDQKTIMNQLLAENNIEFFVAADNFLNDTTEYADIILPSTHWFENDDVVSGYTHPYLLIEEKALSSLWQCKSDWEIFQLLAQTMDSNYNTKYSQYFQGTMKDQVNQILSDAAKNYPQAVADFNANGVARFSPEPYIGFSDLQFNTPSTRLEFYSEAEQLQYPYGLAIPVTKGGDPLVRWEQPTEAWTGTSAQKKYPLQCFQEHVKFRVHSSWFNTPWLREIDPEPIIKMNPTDAQARGIDDGDYVNVYNDRGSAVLKAVFNAGIRPGSVNIPHGWQRDQTKLGGYQELTSSATNPISLNFAYNDIMVEVSKLSSSTALNPKVYPLGQGGNSTQP